MPEGLNKNRTLEKITSSDIPHMDYYKLVGDFNLLLQTELSEKLAQNRDTLDSIVTLVTPGSDGRLEKGSFFTSPLEVIAIVNADIDLNLYQNTLTEVLNHISPTKIAKIIEMKGPKSSMVTAYNSRYQPGRIADSRLIYGSPEAVKNAKVKLGEEIVTLRSNDEVSQIVDLKRNARKVVRTGMNRIAGIDAVHFDLKSGTVFFNPEAHQLSFKIGPLRLVQNTLLVEEVKHTRRENDANFISTLDSNIVNRLGQLSSDRMINLSRPSVEEIAEHYAFFLRLYHRSEQVYEKNKQVALQLTLTEVEEVTKRLQALSLLLEKFKIQKQPR